jgi:hypothetical protein
MSGKTFCALLQVLQGDGSPTRLQNVKIGNSTGDLAYSDLHQTQGDGEHVPYLPNPPDQLIVLVSLELVRVAILKPSDEPLRRGET